MTIDDPTLAERRFTEAHDRILQALVERVHDLSVRLAALEAAAASPDRLAPPAVPSYAAAPTRTPAKDPTTKRTQDSTGRQNRQSTAARPTGWQPARR